MAELRESDHELFGKIVDPDARLALAYYLNDKRADCEAANGS
ncbi:hypothetical protein [Streptomyces sviceus]